MCDYNQNPINHPELSAEKGWTELEIPDSYGKGRAFITGDRNSDRLRVRYFITDSDNSFIARVWFGPSTEGPAGFVHGGSMAAVLDEAMGLAAWIRGYTVVAAKITVQYRKMLPLESVITVEAKVISVNGKKVTTKGKIYNETGALFTESEGLFINIPQEKFGEMIKYRDALQHSWNAKKSD
jgi:acyl-coenzyme A thioesterase PaaI-like protein